MWLTKLTVPLAILNVHPLVLSRFDINRALQSLSDSMVNCAGHYQGHNGALCQVCTGLLTHGA